MRTAFLDVSYADEDRSPTCVLVTADKWLNVGSTWVTDAGGIGTSARGSRYLFIRLLPKY